MLQMIKAPQFCGAFFIIILSIFQKSLDFPRIAWYNIIVERERDHSIKTQGGESMKKPKKKKSIRAVHKIDWLQLFANALTDLIVGTILIIIGKLIE